MFWQLSHQLITKQSQYNTVIKPSSAKTELVSQAYNIEHPWAEHFRVVKVV